MRVHHLNTGTMCPIGRRLVNGTGSIFQRARMVCHCLLIETHDGLALVDTGIGLDDIANPPRLGPKWVRQTTPRLDPAETAVQQVKALGYSPSDVRHLLLTHLDRDHAGGIRSAVLCLCSSRRWPFVGNRRRIQRFRRRIYESRRYIRL